MVDKAATGVLIAVVLAAMAACGDDEGGSGGGGVDTSICNVNSKCPNEPPESDADKRDCKKALEGSCAAQYRALDTCQKANEVCGADGKADINATGQKCAKELEAYVKCATPGRDGG